MPKMGMREEFELQLKDRYTRVNAEIGITVDGRELPNAAVLGDALEKIIKLVQETVTESYKEVPVRDGTTPMATIGQ